MSLKNIMPKRALKYSISYGINLCALKFLALLRQILYLIHATAFIVNVRNGKSTFSSHVRGYTKTFDIEYYTAIRICHTVFV